ncbi:Glycosyltransferase family A domain containing protein [Candidatus Hepatincolaceae symbiont of Richtersius coronifer]
MTRLFTYLDKIIYLDCDIIVLTDLNKLLHEEMQNFYVEGVRDF